MAKKDLSKVIVKKIKAEKVKMRPRVYFVLGSALLGAGFAGAFLFSVIFINRVFFRLRVFGPFGNLVLGRAGIKPFFATFPFLSLTLALMGIAGGLLILKRFEFSYKKSLISLLIGVLTLVLTVGVILDFVGFGERVSQMHAFRPLYSYSAKGSGFVIGEVKAVSGDGLTVVTPEGDEIEVVYDEKTLLPFGADFEEGDRVRAVGEWKGDAFYAKGIGEGGLHWRMTQPPGSNHMPMPTPRVKGNLRGPSMPF